MLRTLRVKLGTDRRMAQRVALKLGVGVESVRSQVRQAGIGEDVKPVVLSAAAAEIQRLDQ